MESFANCAGFCPSCGSILPPLQVKGNVLCFNCKQEFLPEGEPQKFTCFSRQNKLNLSPTVFSGEKTEYTIHFNSYDPSKLLPRTKRESESSEADGPVVERKCPKCNHEKMSYATLQLRSADEGQTVFFTCLKCKWVSLIPCDFCPQN
ncbi:hypothetical protein KR018_007896 [Drosophila ironensis]|nr:hypothetical protein KR018_007896 [Drosophila ironensis]